MGNKKWREEALAVKSMFYGFLFHIKLTEYQKWQCQTEYEKIVPSFHWVDPFYLNDKSPVSAK